MSDVISTGLLSSLSIQQKQEQEAPKSQELGQDVFLELMVTQMRNQNPLDPQENSEFVAQLAQFTSVESLDKLNNTVEGMAGSFQSSQALQASSMVGRAVKVNTETAVLSSGSYVAGTMDIPYSGSEVVMNIYNSSNELVAQELMGAQPAGELPFAWDGVGSDGQPQLPGEYRFEVLATNNGATQQLNTALSANVDSVTVGANGVISLNVAGKGSYSMSQVREIL